MAAAETEATTEAAEIAVATAEVVEVGAEAEAAVRKLTQLRQIHQGQRPNLGVRFETRRHGDIPLGSM